MSISPVSTCAACAPGSPRGPKTGGPNLAASLIRQTLEGLGAPAVSPAGYGPGGRAGTVASAPSLSLRV